VNRSTRRNEEIDLPNLIFNLFAYPFGSGCNFREERLVTYGGSEVGPEFSSVFTTSDKP
jgi:hypothetical protein